MVSVAASRLSQCTTARQHPDRSPQNPAQYRKPIRHTHARQTDDSCEAAGSDLPGLVGVVSVLAALAAGFRMSIAKSSLSPSFEHGPSAWPGLAWPNLTLFLSRRHRNSGPTQLFFHSHPLPRVQVTLPPRAGSLHRKNSRILLHRDTQHNP